MKINRLHIFLILITSLSYTQTTLPPPQLDLPPDGGTDLPLNLTLRWFPVADALNYDVEVDSTGRYHPDSLLISSYGFEDTLISLTNLEYGQNYYWRVRANSDTVVGGWSTTWQFTTGYPPLPAQVNLKEPGYYVQGVPLKPIMKWDRVDYAESYQLQISTDIFSLIFYDKTDIVAESLQIVDGELNETTDYYWRVRAQNISGSGPWSEIWSFTTDYATPPDQVILNQPVNNGTEQSYNQVILQWSVSSRAATYHVQVMSETAQNFEDGPLIANDSLITGTQYSLSGLQPYSWYYWHVRAVNASGKSIWSTVWSFQTQSEPLEKPVLTRPENGQTDISLTPQLSWRAVRNASAYEIQVSYIYDFSTHVYQNTINSDTAVTINSLQANTTYYWRVNASNLQVGSGPWSDPFSFTTANNNQGLTAPLLTSPVENATEIELTPTFTWNSVSEAQAYQIEVSSDPGFESQNIAFAEYSVYQNYITVGYNLTGNTTYYWRVRCVDSGADVGDWSSVWQFTTSAGASGVSAVTYNDAQPGAVSAYVRGYIEFLSGEHEVLFEYSENGSEYNQFVVSGSPFYSAENRDVDAVITGLNPGTNYTYRLIVNSTQGRFEGSEYSFGTNDYPQGYTYSYTISFPKKNRPEDYTPEDYRLVGMPGESYRLLGDLIPGEHGKTWQAYWDNGADQDYLVEYYPDSQGPFVTYLGKGFWLLVPQDVYLDQQTQAAPLHSADMADIWLQKGWNIITNPFPDRTVSWSDVQQINDYNEPLWGFDGSFRTVNEMHPYQGYYLYNSSGSDGVLNIPYTSLPSSGEKVLETALEKWECSISLQMQGKKPITIQFGIESSSRENLDESDYHKPRAVGTITDLYFPRSEWDEKFPAFARDIRQEIGEVQRWPFQVTTVDRKPLQLGCNGLANIPEKYEVFLVDLNKAVGQNLRKESNYPFSPVFDKTDFELLVGKTDEVDKILADLLPSTFTLGKNFPNPFNPQTTIPITLPQESDITLAVYSLLGKRIKVLQKGLLRAGKHYITWSGLDENGRPAASGVYFYVLKTGAGKQFSGKMILLK